MSAAGQDDVGWSLSILYRQMRRVRVFEEWVARLYADGEIPGFCHVSVGQESVPVGVCAALGPRDVITSTHRGHGHVLAKGADPRAMFAELLGRGTGLCRGLGGSMHIADPSLGIFGANGIVAAGIPIAVGAAHAARARGTGTVAVAFFGDGAVAAGAFHEAVNLAALWELPVLLVCENNRYAEFSPWEEQHRISPAERAAGYGLEARWLDGQDVQSVAEVATELVEELRVGAPPRLLEVVVHRWHGHYEGDPQRYRDDAELDAMRREDPLARLRARLDPETTSAVDHEVETEMAAAVEQARADPEPTGIDLRASVAAPRNPVEISDLDGESEIRYVDAVNSALVDSMRLDERVFLAGIDIGAVGGIFRATAGLREAFGSERVLDTPIAETALTGLATGAAMAGLRPVIEIMFVDFVAVCFDQVANQMAKLRFMTGGAAELPIVVRTQYGAGRSAAAQHSQSLEGILAAVPGLSVVIPATPGDAYGLLRTAIEDPNPVVVVEHRHLYGRRGPRPESSHRVPLGRAEVVRVGRDVTLVATGRLVHEGLAAAEELATEGIEVEVIDLRSVAPLDVATVASSLFETTRLAVTHEAPAPFGPGLEVIQAVCETESFWRLTAPPVRIAPEAIPAPYAPSLERAWLPDRSRIAEELRALAAID